MGRTLLDQDYDDDDDNDDDRATFYLKLPKPAGQLRNRDRCDDLQLLPTNTFPGIINLFYILATYSISKGHLLHSHPKHAPRLESLDLLGKH